MAASVFTRLICRKGLAARSNYWIAGKWIAGSCSCSSSSSWFKSANGFYGRQMRFYCSSPWLMLPPVVDGSSMSYKFYSLAENKVLTLGGSGEKELTDLMPNPNRNLKVCGSSHGWLALFNPHNLDLFLYNPLSRRHINLPPIHNLPNYPNDYWSPRGVAKVIISCSPDEEDCRAVIIYNCIDALAFCCPGRSKEWTPIGDLFGWDEDSGKKYTRSYEDFVYSTRHKLFFGLTTSCELETWDLRDPSSPRVIQMIKTDDDKYFNFSEEEKELQRKYLGRPVEYLVVADEELLVVTRYVMEFVGPDGSYVDQFDAGSENCPHMTIDFDIDVYDPEDRELKCVDSSSLGGWALFLGFHSHSVALPATQFPELKPNSIYFTDAFETIASLVGNDDYDKPFGGHDIGIFNYEDKTVSPCYYPCDVRSLKRIMPPPMWFFPSRPI